MKSNKTKYLSGLFFITIIGIIVHFMVKADRSRKSQAIIEELVVDYGSYQDDAATHIDVLLKELKSVDSDLGSRWTKIMDLWRSLNHKQELNFDVLPDGLSDSDDLCIVILGFQLEPDGTMREELIERLNVALRSAKKYPNSYIVCTGGGTAKDNEDVTEAKQMARWLISKGITEERIIVEDQSLTTAQNAMYTYDILSAQYPQIRNLVIVSSDYHIATGLLLFEAEAILRNGQADYEVVSNACWRAPSGSLSTMFEAGALIELSGDTETAFDIYYDHYDIHELPPLN